MKGRLVSLGPCAVPVVCVKQFSKLQMSRATLKEVWQLIGPSVEMNITRLPMWEVIAAAYLEGMNHGAGIVQEKVDKEKQMAAENSKWFVPRSSLGKGFDHIYEVQERLVDGTWRLHFSTNDRQEAIARAVLLNHKGGEARIIDNTK